MNVVSWSDFGTGQRAIQIRYGLLGNAGFRRARETIHLQATKPNYGGFRWWFTCPLILGGIRCKNRVGKLYLPPDGLYFGCRRCYALTYRSVQEHDHRIALLGANREALSEALDAVNSADPDYVKFRLACKATGIWEHVQQTVRETVVERCRSREEDEGRKICEKVQELWAGGSR